MEYECMCMCVGEDHSCTYLDDCDLDYCLFVCVIKLSLFLSLNILSNFSEYYL